MPDGMRGEIVTAMAGALAVAIQACTRHRTRRGALRWLLVTPDLHRVHHSIHRDEQDSNFGFNLSLWDRLARTYRAEPRQGHAQMVLGLDGCQHDAPTRMGWSLRLPWMKELAAMVAEPRQ